MPVRFQGWPVARVVFLLAGALGVSGLALGMSVHPAFFLLAALPAAMQAVFALTGFCPSVILLRKLGFACPLDAHPAAPK